jgi:hypothetical protein
VRLASTCGTPGQTYLSSNSASVSQTPYGPLVAPTMNASVSGTTITWSWSTNRGSDGRPDWTASISGECAGTPVSAGSYARDFGYSSGTRNCAITVSAGGASLSDDAPASTPPPPPPPTVTVTVPPPDRTCPERDFTGPSNWNGGACNGEGAGWIAVGTSLQVSCRLNQTYGTWNPWLRISSGGPGAGWYVAAGTVSGGWSALPVC